MRYFSLDQGGGRITKQRERRGSRGKYRFRYEQICYVDLLHLPLLDRFTSLFKSSLKGIIKEQLPADQINCYRARFTSSGSRGS